MQDDVFWMMMFTSIRQKKESYRADARSVRKRFAFSNGTKILSCYNPSIRD